MKTGEFIEYLIERAQLRFQHRQVVWEIAIVPTTFGQRIELRVDFGKNDMRVASTSLAGLHYAFDLKSIADELLNKVLGRE